MDTLEMRGNLPECEDCPARVMIVDENGRSYECYERVCIYDQDR